jgi:hypothetical protein
VLEQHVEQRIEIVAVGNLAVSGLDGADDTGSSRGVERRQPECVLGGRGGLVVEVGSDVEQQVVAGLDDLGDPSGGRLVDHQDHRQVRGSALRSTTGSAAAGPRTSTSGTVDGRAALHLAPKSAWPGVDNVMTVTPSG